MKESGHPVSISKLCKWFNVPHSAVIECCDRNIIGWRLSKRGIAQIAAAALEDAAVLRKINGTNVVLRSDNGLVFGSKAFTKVVNRYRFIQEFITPRGFPHRTRTGKRDDMECFCRLFQFMGNISFNPHMLISKFYFKIVKLQNLKCRRAV